MDAFFPNFAANDRRRETLGFDREQGLFSDVQQRPVLSSYSRSTLDPWRSAANDYEGREEDSRCEAAVWFFTKKRTFMV